MHHETRVWRRDVFELEAPEFSDGVERIIGGKEMSYNKPDDSILLMLNDDGVAEVYDDTYDITIHCTSEEEQKKAEAMLQNCMRWIPIEERLPENEEYVLVSFGNFSLADIAHYEADDNGGAFYPGDDDRSYSSYGLFVNAWMPVPKPYKPD